jgi:hypothetical protein
LAFDGFFEDPGFFFALVFAAFFAAFFGAFGLPPTKMIIVSSFRFLVRPRRETLVAQAYPP